mmetsp:Transcript_32444/g.72868  ORF Transcript_32444/g.72868 Transcript_32444/m.72868 type:complete len:216 (+) Transcript_32444:1854-2501(+)
MGHGLLRSELEGVQPRVCILHLQVLEDDRVLAGGQEVLADNLGPQPPPTFPHIDPLRAPQLNLDCQLDSSWVQHSQVSDDCGLAGHPRRIGHNLHGEGAPGHVDVVDYHVDLGGARAGRGEAGAASARDSACSAVRRHRAERPSRVRSAVSSPAVEADVLPREVPAFLPGEYGGLCLVAVDQHPVGLQAGAGSRIEEPILGEHCDSSLRALHSSD